MLAGKKDALPQLKRRPTQKRSAAQPARRSRRKEGLMVRLLEKGPLRHHQSSTLRPRKRINRCRPGRETTSSEGKKVHFFSRKTILAMRAKKKERGKRRSRIGAGTARSARRRCAPPVRKKGNQIYPAKKGARWRSTSQGVKPLAYLDVIAEVKAFDVSFGGSAEGTLWSRKRPKRGRTRGGRKRKPRSSSPAREKELRGRRKGRKKTPTDGRRSSGGGRRLKAQPDRMEGDQSK